MKIKTNLMNAVIKWTAQQVFFKLFHLMFVLKTLFSITAFWPSLFFLISQNWENGFQELQKLTISSRNIHGCDKMYHN